MQLRFVSRNQHKFKEAAVMLSGTDLSLIPAELRIEEIQTTDEKSLVRDKALKAFEKIGKPLIVEHTGLYLEALNNLPGGLTQTFWDKLGPDRFCQLFGKTNLRAKTIICLCDGNNFYYFSGEVDGSIAPKPQGNRDFQWDCVFIPLGHKKTFAEMGSLKNKISMRKKAFDDFINHIKK